MCRQRQSKGPARLCPTSTSNASELFRKSAVLSWRTPLQFSHEMVRDGEAASTIPSRWSSSRVRQPPSMTSIRIRHFTCAAVGRAPWASCQSTRELFSHCATLRQVLPLDRRLRLSSNARLTCHRGPWGGARDPIACCSARARLRAAGTEGTPGGLISAGMGVCLPAELPRTRLEHHHANGFFPAPEPVSRPRAFPSSGLTGAVRCPFRFVEMRCREVFTLQHVFRTPCC